MAARKSKSALEASAAAEVASAALERIGDRPDDDQPEAQAEYDALADATKGGVNPDDGGYDVDLINAEFSLVCLGRQVLILWEKQDAPLKDQQRFMTSEAFKLLYSNRFTEVLGSDRKPRSMTWPERWLKDYNRAQFDGIEFHPDPKNEGGTPGYKNLWCGFSVQPKNGGSYAIFRDHLLNNVCNGDEAVFRWLFAWFAQIVQKPREKPGTAIILRGAMGSGKTKVGQVFGSLISRHYSLVDDPRYITGQFNAHMISCLLLQADEAVWAGDKAAEGKLRGLVTSTTHMIEQKGVDPEPVENYIRLMMTSNEDWVIPAGKDERRFAVLDVNPRCAQHHEYFAEMDAELDSGGREALLHDLLAFDLSKVKLRVIPKTAALLEQKKLSLGAIDNWFLGRLENGAPTKNHDRWPEVIEVASLYNDYINESEKVGHRRRADQTAFGMRLNKIIPDLRKERHVIATDGGAQKRCYVYVLPTLERCREAFAETFGQDLGWDSQDDQD
jgi:hypothetical protein